MNNLNQPFIYCQIKPIYDGASTTVIRYGVYDLYGNYMFEGTQLECKQYLNKN